MIGRRRAAIAFLVSASSAAVIFSKSRSCKSSRSEKVSAASTSISSLSAGISSIPPGRTEEFKVRLGPLPDRGQIVFKALQYYADGQVVRWIQNPTEDAERPAAVLDLGGGADAIATDDDSGGFPWPLIAALVFVVALGVVGVTLGRRRGI